MLNSLTYNHNRCWFLALRRSHSASYSVRVCGISFLFFGGKQMNEKTVLEEVKEQMHGLLEARRIEMGEIQKNMDKYHSEMIKQEEIEKEAVENLNEKAYTAARKAKEAAKLSTEMYRERRDQIAKLEYMSEEDSDAVIDKLLAYESMAAEDFKAALAEPLSEIREALSTYLTAINETEKTIVEWGECIRPNRNSRGRTFYRETQSFYSVDPIPVHNIPFRGCPEALYLEGVLEHDAIKNLSCVWA